MKKVLMLNTANSYLPEVNAYIKYFSENPDFRFYDSKNIKDYRVSDFDIVWKFMGLDLEKHKELIVVHEYLSLSACYFPGIKNYIKKIKNVKPSLRIFLNEFIKDEFNFKDKLPFCIRDMGIDDVFFSYVDTNKEYDFVYVGEISNERKIHILLDKFKPNGSLSKYKILVIGKPAKNIYCKYKKYSNIIFTGRLEHSDVAKEASKAIYGVNWVPNKYPYNFQTATKLLEYCAMNLKIITLRTNWSTNFEKKNTAAFYNLDNINDDLRFSNLENFFYSIPDVSNLTWQNIIRDSQIYELLKSII
ncbi:hypothetical protein ACFL5N_02120 [bacterium]